MSQAKAGSPVLLVAHDPGLRRQLEHALGEDVRVIARLPDALGNPAELVDAAAAVAVIE